MSRQKNEFDVIGVGFGPANIAVAIAMEEMGFPYTVRFFEKEPDTTAIWQKEMLIEHSDIQNHPLRDLVTPRNPRSKYTFVNYLFENGRLFEHLNLGLYYPYRIEYAQYISWVARHFDPLVHYGTPVNHIGMMVDDQGIEAGYRVLDAAGNEYFSRALVLAPGRTPYIPPVFEKTGSGAVCHISKYLQTVKSVLAGNKQANIAVIGGSQSAVEAILHLSDTYPDATITGVLRNFGYRLKDASPFTGEVYFPEFVDMFYNAAPAAKERLSKDLHYTNYSAVDGDVLDRLYRKMYMQRISSEQKIKLHRMAQVVLAQESGHGVGLTIQKIESTEPVCEQFDLVILATGFMNTGTQEGQEPYPPILQYLLPWLALDEQSCIQTGYDYRLVMNEAANRGWPCFLNGLCESTHGMGDAGSFSLLALRSQTIVTSLMRQLSQQSSQLSAAENNVLS